MHMSWVCGAARAEGYSSTVQPAKQPTLEYCCGARTALNSPDPPTELAASRQIWRILRIWWRLFSLTDAPSMICLLVLRLQHAKVVIATTMLKVEAAGGECRNDLVGRRR